MKCAMEAMTIAMVNKARLDEEERQAEILRVQRVREATVKYIEETISPALDYEVTHGRLPTFKVTCSKWLDTCSPLERGKDYADGSRSYHGSETKFSLPILTEELAKYCYVVKTKPYEYYHWGFGKMAGITIEISPDPECL